MAFIGKEPQTGAYSMLDALTASATASYSLTLDSTAFVPESANHLLVSLNGVIQKAGSSYTVSGSTLTFSSSLASSDSIDFVLALGNVLDIGTPSDSTVTNAKTNFVSTSSAAGLQIKGDNTTAGTLQLNCEQNSHGIKLKSPAHSTSSSYTLTFPGTDPAANKMLQTDGSGNLSFVDAPSGGLNFISKHTASDGDSYLTLDGVFSSTYDNYLLVGTLWQNNTDNNHLRIQFKTTSFSADSIYDSQMAGINSGGVGHTINQNNSAYGTMGGLGNQGSASNELSNFQLTIYQPADQNTHQFWQSHHSGKDANGGYIAGTGGGVWEDLTAVTGIRFYYGAGTIKSGEVLLYGIQSS